MRDFFEMYYMPGGTNGVDENGNQIIDDWGERFILEDWDGGFRAGGRSRSIRTCIRTFTVLPADAFKQTPLR